jgi:hypothetical protein
VDDDDYEIAVDDWVEIQIKSGGKVLWALSESPLVRKALDLPSDQRHDAMPAVQLQCPRGHTLGEVRLALRNGEPYGIRVTGHGRPTIEDGAPGAADAPAPGEAVHHGPDDPDHHPTAGLKWAMPCRRCSYRGAITETRLLDLYRTCLELGITAVPVERPRTRR